MPERQPKQPRPRKKRVPKGAPVPMIDVDRIQLPPGLLGRIIPGNEVGADGHYEATYGMFAIPHGGAAQLGTLRIARSTVGDGTTLKLTMHDGQCPGYVQKVEATIRCKSDRLASPVKWDVSEEMLHGDRHVPFTKIGKTGALADGSLTMSDSTGKRTLQVGDVCALNWALFDAVGRLPRKPFDPIAFDLIDHFDQFKPGNTIRYRSSQRVKLGQREVPLHLFDQFGAGVLPWTYFVNEGGLTVLAVAGLKAYALIGNTRGKGGAR